MKIVSSVGAVIVGWGKLVPHCTLELVLFFASGITCGDLGSIIMFV